MPHQIYDLQIFAPLLWKSSHFIDGVFWVTEVFNVKSDFAVFSFVACAFVSYLRNHCLPYSHEDSSLVFSSKSFRRRRVLALPFWSLINFEYWCMVCRCPNSSFLQVNSELSQQHLLKTFSFLFNFLDHSVKTVDHKCKVYFGALSFIDLYVCP